MSFDDLSKELPPEENISAISESFLIKKLDEVIPAMMSLSTRVAILEGQIAWLLSKDAEYVKALDEYENANKETITNEEQKN